MNQSPTPSNLRPFNEHEQRLSLTMSASVHFLIRTLDQMQHTNMYRHRMKQVGNQFLTELEKHASVNVWAEIGDDTDINAVASQMEDIVQLFNNLLMTALSLGELHQAQQHLFWIEMQKQFKRFDVPLGLSINGDLEVINKLQLETV